jgi:hypothetical protein
MFLLVWHSENSQQHLMRLMAIIPISVQHLPASVLLAEARNKV